MNYTKSGKVQRVRDLIQDLADIDAQVENLNNSLVKFAADKVEIQTELDRVTALEVPEDGPQGAPQEVKL